ncbi:hypothetical protein MKX01_037058 [Papaver californicum]|nr:hypothetical protein MKX01_037058 [Papaver californicum]
MRPDSLRVGSDLIWSKMPPVYGARLTTFEDEEKESDMDTFVRYQVQSWLPMGWQGLLCTNLYVLAMSLIREIIRLEGVSATIQGWLSGQGVLCGRKGPVFHILAFRF